MRAYQLQSGGGIGGLKRVELPSRDVGAHEIRVRIDAASLNNRDLSFARGHFYNPPAHPLVPLVDGCGTVLAVGSAVTRFKTGERVITTYYPRWIDGKLSPAKTAISFGAQVDGTLAEELVGHEEHFVAAPSLARRRLRGDAAMRGRDGLECAVRRRGTAARCERVAPRNRRRLIVGTAARDCRRALPDRHVFSG